MEKAQLKMVEGTGAGGSREEGVAGSVSGRGLIFLWEAEEGTDGVERKVEVWRVGPPEERRKLLTALCLSALRFPMKTRVSSPWAGQRRWIPKIRQDLRGGQQGPRSLSAGCYWERGSSRCPEARRSWRQNRPGIETGTWKLPEGVSGRTQRRQSQGQKQRGRAGGQSPSRAVELQAGICAACPL